MSTTNTCRFLPAARVELEVVARLDVVEVQSQAGHARPSIYPKLARLEIDVV